MKQKLKWDGERYYRSSVMVKSAEQGKYTKIFTIHNHHQK